MTKMSLKKVMSNQNTSTKHKDDKLYLKQLNLVNLFQLFNNKVTVFILILYILSANNRHLQFMK